MSQTQAVLHGLGSQEEGQPRWLGVGFLIWRHLEFCLAEPVIVHKPCGLLGKGKMGGAALEKS